MQLLLAVEHGDYILFDSEGRGVASQAAAVFYSFGEPKILAPYH